MTVVSIMQKKLKYLQSANFEKEREKQVPKNIMKFP